MVAAKSAFSANKFIQSVLSKAVGQASVKLQSGYYVKLRRELEAAANKEAMKMFPLIANQLIGTESRGASPYVLTIPTSYAGGEVNVLNSLLVRSTNSIDYKAYKGVTWRPLSFKTIQRKGHSRFFEDTGALKSFMAKQSAISVFGGVKTYVSFKTPTKLVGSFVPLSVLLGKIRFSVFPKIRAYLGNLAGGKFDSNVRMERQLFGHTIGDKLQGFKFNAGTHRPLIQPVASFYLNVAIPNAIIRNVKRRGAVSLSKQLQRS
jgi:hypothetical protein